jgi:hypothetical protein
MAFAPFNPYPTRLCTSCSSNMGVVNQKRNGTNRSIPILVCTNDTTNGVTILMATYPTITRIALPIATAIFLFLYGCNTQSVSTSSGHSNDPPTVRTPVGMFCFGGIPTAVNSDKRTADMEAQQAQKSPPTVGSIQNSPR